MNRNLLIVAVAISIGATLSLAQYRDNHDSTVWQYDKYRQEAARVKREEALAEDFHRTNTNPAMGGVVIHNFIYNWNPQKGDRELGYRIDGVVVWREFPEGK